MTWVIITVGLLAGLAFFAYHYPDLFKNSVDSATDATKKEIDKVIKK